MILSAQDAELFYKLMHMFYLDIDAKQNIHPACKTLSDFQRLTPQDVISFRKAWMQKPSLLEEFITKKPPALSGEELEIVKSWRHALHTDFYIERYMAKHAIFIRDNDVYAVLGLTTPLEEIFPRSYLPRLVKALLLPFKGQIVYDGLMHSQNIFFGKNMRSRFKETYMRAKQNNRIIHTLGPVQVTLAGPPQVSKDWSKQLTALASKARDLKAEAGEPAIHAPAFAMIRAGIEFAQNATEEPENTSKLLKEARKLERALKKVFMTLERAED